ncbi:MAG: DUF116 domain-containing protein [Methanomassiliicoccaceae archaeon]|nr:DUF116 domain-containing protein [Methanomassiliicoccaceae archaeon]
MDFVIDSKGKSLFLILSALSLALLVTIAALLLWLASPRLHEMSAILATAIIIAAVAFFLIVTVGMVILFAVCYGKRPIGPFHRLIRFSINVIFQVNMLIGRLLFIPKERIEESFVKVNNAFLKAGRQRFKAEEVLILLPHCLQNHDCSHRVVNNINNCTECGKCVIVEFKDLSKKCPVNIAVVPGGTLARMMIVQTRPSCIIAVACHRDLADGLLETFPIPGYGILNDRPFGPCMNTDVDIGKVRRFLDHFVISP